jgi:hypothetical protein
VEVGSVAGDDLRYRIRVQGEVLHVSEEGEEGRRVSEKDLL